MVEGVVALERRIWARSVARGMGGGKAGCLAGRTAAEGQAREDELG